MSVFDTVNKIIATLGSVDWTSVSALILVLVMAILMWRINTSRSSTFFFDDMFLDEDGKASTSKLSNLIALVLSSWAFVHLTIKGSLTEWFFSAYMMVWVANRGVAQYLSMKEKSLDSSNKLAIKIAELEHSSNNPKSIYDSPEEG